MSKSKEVNKPRFVSDDWDQPQVNLQKDSDRPTLRRKVITKGVYRINLGNVAMNEIKTKLRQGYEVRLSDAIRLYPCVDTDYKTMFVAGATIGEFRQLLNDKKFRLVHNGDEMNADQVEEYGLKHFNEKQTEVTPDTLVTCPKCGNKFRVGRRINN